MEIQFKIGSASGDFTKRIDLSSLPVTHVDKSSRLLGFFLMVFGLFWGAVPAMMLVSALSGGRFDGGMVFAVVLAGIGAAMVLGGFNLLFGSTTMAFGVHGLTVTKKSLFGSRQWSDEFRSFEGVLSRSEYHSGSKNSPSYTLYVVELKHNDAKKTVRLYESRSDLGFRAVWEDYCRQLNLPALELDGARTVKRDAADLDKSIKELVKEGKLKVDFDPTRPPPRELALRVDGTVLEFTVVRKKASSLAGMFIMLAFPAVLMGIGFLVKGVPAPVGVVGAVLFALFLLFSVWSMLTREQIRIGGDEIQTRQLTPWGVSGGEAVRSSEIETVRIGTEDGRGQDSVLLETDAGIVSIGKGLSAESLTWLKNCVLRVISA